jgi:ankyrin repeat protein
MADTLQRFPRANEDLIDPKGNGLVACAVMYGDVNMVELLAQEGFNINGKDIHGNTPLHYAMSANFKKIQ